MVVIRLTSIGKRGKRHFRVVVKEKRSRRDGTPIEYLGWVERTEKGTKKEINLDRFKYWVSKGAVPSPTVSALVKA